MSVQCSAVDPDHCVIAPDSDPSVRLPGIRIQTYELDFSCISCIMNRIHITDLVLCRNITTDSIPTDPARIMIRIWILAVDPDTEKKNYFRF